MKRNKRITAFVLALVLLLAGCGNGQLSTTAGTTEYISTTTGTTEHVLPTDEITKPSNSANETTGSTELEGSVTCQYLPKTVENPDNLPVLKWVCLTDVYLGGGKRTWNEEATVELNRMLADRDMPFRIQFVLLTTNRRLADNNKWFTFPEAQEALKDADLIYGDMTTEAITQYLTPITEYVIGTAEPSLKNAVAHEANWLTGMVNGEFYGYGTYIYEAYGSGWAVDSALLTASGLTAEDFQRDFWEMDEVFAKLYAANGNLPFMLYGGNGSIRSNNYISGELGSVRPLSIDALIPEYYDTIGSCFVVDYSEKTPTVVNYLETDTVRKIQKAIARYVNAEYYTRDVEYARLSYGTINALTLYREDNESVFIPRTNTYFKGTGSWGLISGVAAVSEHKLEAVSLLNLIAEDEAFRMQLFYGEEGRDYVIEDGYYVLVTQENGSNYSLDFLSPLSYFCGLTSNPATADMKSPSTEKWSLVAQEGKSTLQSYQDALDSSIFCYPIIFDYSGLEQELAAMDAIFEKYFPSFSSSQVTNQYDQMLQELKAAGSDKILAELQRQLSEWQKNNPDWPLQSEE